MGGVFINFWNRTIVKDINVTSTSKLKGIKRKGASFSG